MPVSAKYNPLVAGDPPTQAFFDYDKSDIHKTYGAGRALNADQVEVWSAVFREALAGAAARRIVDLGCGIGRFSAMLRDVSGAAVYGVDRSARMLAMAASDPATHGIPWVRASGEALPLRAGAVDLILMFLVFHHVVDRAACLRECARVLSPRGVLIIVNSTVETLDTQRWLPFFPSARAIDLARIPSHRGLVDLAASADFSLSLHRVVLNPVAPNLRVYADRVARRTISTLQLVSDDEFARGIADFRRWCEGRDRGERVDDEIDVFAFRRAVTT